MRKLLNRKNIMYVLLVIALVLGGTFMALKG